MVPKVFFPLESTINVKKIEHTSELRLCDSSIRQVIRRICLSELPAAHLLTFRHCITYFLI